MSSTEEPPELAGLALDDAVDVVVATYNVDRDRATTILRSVADDGVVSREAVSDRLGHVSKVVSTPETRLELTERTHQAIIDRVEEAPDYETITARLTQYETRLDDIREAISNLGTQLQTLIDRRDDGALFPLARDLEQLSERAKQLQQQADKLNADLETFADWLDDPSVRADRLAEDVNLLEEGLASLEATVDDVSPDADEDADRQWFDASLRQRVFALLVADLRFEYRELAEWEATIGADATGLEAVDERIDALEMEITALNDQLKALARSAWIDRFADRFDAFETELDAFDPPVHWGAVQDVLAAHRPDDQQDSQA